MPLEEGLEILDLIKDVMQKTKTLAAGEVTICNNNKKLLREVENEVKRDTEFTNEANKKVKN